MGVLEGVGGGGIGFESCGDAAAPGAFCVAGVWGDVSEERDGRW